MKLNKAGLQAQANPMAAISAPTSHKTSQGLPALMGNDSVLHPRSTALFACF